MIGSTHLPLGSELWALYYSAELNNYEPRLEGKVKGISGGCYVVGKKRIPLGTYPLFGTKAEADAYVLKHPFAAPAIR